jgi:hypothetical protein
MLYMLVFALHNMLVGAGRKMLVIEQHDKLVTARMCERLYF